jgi:hypothetical protein
MMRDTTPEPKDAALEARIASLKSAVELWARGRDLWEDCGFKTYLEHVAGEPGDCPALTVLWFDGPLGYVFNGTYDDGAEEELRMLLDGLGFWYELQDCTSVGSPPWVAFETHSVC